jgi:predicted AAA+ superfamily ATPase
MRYLPRIIDTELRDNLRRSGAVLVTGPKACGKTESARQAAKSEVRMDTDPNVGILMATDPGQLLIGEVPRLLDEWQEFPGIWNHVRHTVDDRQSTGQFILTGSANPSEDVKMHSGAGRISRLRMRPMTWWEMGYSTGEVSLGGIVAGEPPRSAIVNITLDQIIEHIAIGGWPALIDKELEDALVINQDYVSLLAETDISRVSERRRDPEKVRRLLSSYARNTATPASVATLAQDSGGADGSLADATVLDYIETLSRLMIIEDLPAWNTHLRSKATLRMTPKRHFCDPSLAVAALGAGPETLRSDLVFLGFLFESEVLRDLRVFAQSLRATLWQYRDSKRRESDIILQMPNGTWAAFEVKLGFGQADEGAASLLRVKREVDTEKTGPCLALTVITGFGAAHRRPDGVNVVPLASLKA